MALLATRSSSIGDLVNEDLQYHFSAQERNSQFLPPPSDPNESKRRLI